MNTAHHGSDGVVALVGTILRGTPHLPGAACRGSYELFDDVAREDATLRATCGNEDPGCRIAAGQGPLSARSPVVGKRTPTATGSAGRAPAGYGGGMGLGCGPVSGNTLLPAQT
ncbi:MAG: hypothetical protein ACRDTT_01285 [Pseudonocardiaceae bacterium]